MKRTFDRQIEKIIPHGEETSLNPQELNVIEMSAMVRILTRELRKDLLNVEMPNVDAMEKTYKEMIAFIKREANGESAGESLSSDDAKEQILRLEKKVELS